MTLAVAWTVCRANQLAVTNVASSIWRDVVVYVDTEAFNDFSIGQTVDKYVVDKNMRHSFIVFEPDTVAVEITESKLSASTLPEVFIFN